MNKDRFRDKQFIVLSVVIAVLLALTLISPLLIAHDPFRTNMRAAFLPPSAEYIFGTDNLGRCVFCRIAAGSSTSVFTGLAVVLLSAAIGTLLGITAGFFGGLFDEIISDLITIFQAFPSFVLAIAIAGIMGQSLLNGIIALCAVYWTTYAKLSRSLVQQIRSDNYVKTAWLDGAGRGALLGKYILPRISSSVIVTTVLDFGSVVLAMSGLSFLGLGAVRPTAEWGAVMSEARDYMQKAPWIILFNGLALFLVVCSFNLFGEKLGDILLQERKNET